MNGIPEYGTGRHEDYLTQREERAEVARDLEAEPELEPAPTLGEVFWDAYRGEPRRPGWSVPHSPFSKLSDAHREAVEIGARAVAAHVTGSHLPPATPPDTEWAVFWGGEDPDDCAGSDVYGDEADADENRQWIIGGGLATRPVWRGPWTVVKPPAAGLAPGEDPDDNLTDAQRADYLRWRAGRAQGREG